MRAGYTAVVIGLVGGLLAATAVLSAMAPRATTVAAALGLDGSDPPGLGERRAAAVAALTAACMADLGLAWVPLPEPAPSIPDADLDPEPWAARWGFGVSTASEMPDPSVPIDVNAVRVASLAPGERAAYVEALHGARGRSGCQSDATEAVFGLRDRLTAPLRPRLTALHAAIDADPGTVAARDAWGGCVATVVGGRPANRASFGSELVASFVRQFSTVEDPTALTSLQAEERRVATVVARCEVAFAEARAAVAAPHEATFVVAHGRELRAIAASIRAAEAALPTIAPSAP